MTTKTYKASVNGIIFTLEAASFEEAYQAIKKLTGAAFIDYLGGV
jgi:hypothetical protein